MERSSLRQGSTILAPSTQAMQLRQPLKKPAQSHLR
jgi:hypothetical protein